MRNGLFARALLALPLLVATGAAAQNTGELWEITMQIPGMPAGMAMPAQRVCQGDDPERAATQDKSRKDCKVTGRKQTATRTTVSMACADGTTMTIDQQYNAARTEFKSTMSMKSSKDGDMTMTSTGRKVGTCNVQQARREQDEQVAAAKKQAEAGMAASAAAQKQQADMQIKQCNAALESMNFSSLGAHGQCYKKTADKQCQAIAQAYPEAAKTCSARTAEFCRRFQTQEGFLKAGANENAAQMCGVSTASIKAAQCPKAAQGGSLAFLGAYCPVEAKPIAQEHCTGRDYTSKMGGKYAQFCQSYLANADFERPPGAAPATGKTQGEQAADQVKEGVSKGIDKLRGLFGR